MSISFIFERQDGFRDHRTPGWIESWSLNGGQDALSPGTFLHTHREMRWTMPAHCLRPWLPDNFCKSNPLAVWHSLHTGYAPLLDIQRKSTHYPPGVPTHPSLSVWLLSQGCAL